jgi:hypothetical protein
MADLPTDAAALMTSLKCGSSYQTWVDSAGTTTAEAYPITLAPNLRSTRHAKPPSHGVDLDLVTAEALALGDGNERYRVGPTTMLRFEPGPSAAAGGWRSRPKLQQRISDFICDFEGLISGLNASKSAISRDPQVASRFSNGKSSIISSLMKLQSRRSSFGSPDRRLKSAD